MFNIQPAGLRRVAATIQPQTHRGTPHHALRDRPQRAALEQLALPLFTSLYNHAHCLTRNQAEAEDLVQETFTKALRAFDSFQQDANLKAWIFRIFRNTFLTTRAGTASSRTVFFEDHPDTL